MMSPEDLQQTLQFLKAGRKRLVSDFINENPELYTLILKSENNTNTIDSKIDKYFFGWLTSHFSIENTVDINISNKMAVAYEQLCQLHCHDTTKFFNEAKYTKTNKLIKEHIKLIDRLLAVEKRNDDRIAQFNYIIEKSRHLFKIEFEKAQNVNSVRSE